MTRYIYDHPDWPHFQWDGAGLSARLAETRYLQGRLIGRIEALSRSLQDDANIRILTDDAVKTSAIEGERLDPDEVRSSFARRLGVEDLDAVASSRSVDGLVAMLADATENHDAPLTKQRLFQWHVWLFADGGGQRRPITVGAWRTDELGAMQVVSDRLDRPKVFFEGPAAARVDDEMTRFIDWFEDRDKSIDPLIEAAIAHIRFVTIHPFDDGNGRIGRAVADLAIARAERLGRRFYSVSAILKRERPQYYAGLEATQKGDLDITPRLAWFIDIVAEAIRQADSTLSRVLRKARFWRDAESLTLNDRQRRMLNVMLDGSLIGPLTTSKWAKMNPRCSQDTALRDIDALVSLGLLVKSPSGGRSTHYVLADEGS